MPAANAPIVDQWSGLSHKLPIATTARGPASTLAPGWVPAGDRRRLDAYIVLAAYLGNVARAFLPVDQWDEAREYGDARLLVSRVVAGLLGDDPQIVVEGADADLTLGPPLPSEPPTPDVEDPISVRVHAELSAHRDSVAAEILEDWSTALQAQPSLTARQEWLRDWADVEGWWSKLVESETDAVGLGDSLIEVRLSADRPRIRVYDPGFYLPVLADDTEDFGERVHVAWEFADHQGRAMLRRRTWQLAVLDFEPDPDEPGRFLVDDEGRFVAPPTFDGVDQRVDADGAIVRHYPWSPADPADPGHWTPWTVLFSEGVWPLEGLGSDIDALNEDRAIWQITESGQVARNLDLGMDFIPLVHIPNTPASKGHFGTSLITPVAQLADEIRAGDTDLSLAAALAAVPMIHAAGATSADIVVAPGTVLATTAEGSMTVIDLAGSIGELRSLEHDRRSLLAQNAQVPEEILGRVNSGDSKSGVQMGFALSPFGQVIDMLRAVRSRKHPLVLKMVQRIAQLGGWLEPGETPRATIAYGAWLPTDRAAAVDEATGLLGAHAASLRTVLRMLIDAGVPIGDVGDEIDRIVAENTEAAVQVADATGSELLAARRLGFDEIPGATSPVIVLPEP